MLSGCGQTKVSKKGVNPSLLGVSEGNVICGSMLLMS